VYSRRARVDSPTSLDILNVLRALCSATLPPLHRPRLSLPSLCRCEKHKVSNSLSPHDVSFLSPQVTVDRVVMPEQLLNFVPEQTLVAACRNPHAIYYDLLSPSKVRPHQFDTHLQDNLPTEKMENPLRPQDSRLVRVKEFVVSLPALM
jgi:hypothetical protein